MARIVIPRFCSANDFMHLCNQPASLEKMRVQQTGTSDDGGAVTAAVTGRHQRCAATVCPRKLPSWHIEAVALADELRHRDELHAAPHGCASALLAAVHGSRGPAIATSLASGFTALMCTCTAAPASSGSS